MTSFHAVPDHGILQSLSSNFATFGNEPYDPAGPGRLLSPGEVHSGEVLKEGDWLKFYFDPGITTTPLPNTLFGLTRADFQACLVARGGSLLIPVTMAEKSYISLTPDNAPDDVKAEQAAKAEDEKSAEKPEAKDEKAPEAKPETPSVKNEDRPESPRVETASVTPKDVEGDPAPGNASPVKQADAHPEGATKAENGTHWPPAQTELAATKGKGHHPRHKRN